MFLSQQQTKFYTRIHKSSKFKGFTLGDRYTANSAAGTDLVCRMLATDLLPHVGTECHVSIQLVVYIWRLQLRLPDERAFYQVATAHVRHIPHATAHKAQRMKATHKYNLSVLDLTYCIIKQSSAELIKPNFLFHRFLIQQIYYRIIAVMSLFLYVTACTDSAYIKFVIHNLKVWQLMMFHRLPYKQYSYIVCRYLCDRFLYQIHKSCFTGSLVTSIKPKAKYVLTAALLLLHILQNKLLSHAFFPRPIVIHHFRTQTYVRLPLAPAHIFTHP
jgi:hypothetical protein